MEIDQELTEKSAKNTHRYWKMTATIVVIGGDRVTIIRIESSVTMVTKSYNLRRLFFTNGNLFHSFEAGNCVSNSSFE